MWNKVLFGLGFAGFAAACLGQVAGGQVFRQGQQGSNAAAASEQAKRQITKDEMPPGPNSMYLDASVMANVKADQYVAVMGLVAESESLEAANQKMADTVSKFVASLTGLGILAKEIYVDFIAQNRIYGYDVAGDVATERVTGYQIKKNVSIHFKKLAMLDTILDLGAKQQVFDLVKLDYVVTDQAKVQAVLMKAAGEVLKAKAANLQKNLGLKTSQPKQVYAERYGAYFPTEMYNSYAAYEAENVNALGYRPNMVVVGARKLRTFYYNALDGKLFDRVIDPVVTEPVVQFTLYLKVRVDVGGPAAKPATKPKKKA